MVKLMHRWVELTHSKRGCVNYHVHAIGNEPNTFVFYENWRSRKDFEEHLKTPYLKSFWDHRRVDYLTEDVDVRFITMQSEFEPADAR